jgi:hypothetical protein
MARRAWGVLRDGRPEADTYMFKDDAERNAGDKDDGAKVARVVILTEYDHKRLKRILAETLIVLGNPTIDKTCSLEAQADDVAHYHELRLACEIRSELEQLDKAVK